jgi:hypothetical protein
MSNQAPLYPIHFPDDLADECKLILARKSLPFPNLVQFGRTRSHADSIPLAHGQP